MKFQVIYDLAQYNGVMTPIEDELNARGWEVIKSNTGNYNSDREVKGSIGCQHGAWITERPPIKPSFLIFHGVSFIKVCSKEYDNWDYVIVPSKTWEDYIDGSNGNAKPIGIGWSKSDILINNRQNQNNFKELIRKRHRLDDKPIVLLAPSYYHSNNKKQISGTSNYSEEIIRSLSNYNVIFIPHMMCEYKNKVNKDFLQVSADYTKKHEYLLGADLLISDISSIIFEFALLDKPIIMINNSKVKNYLCMLDTNEVVDIGCIVNTQDIKIKLPETVYNCLKDPTVNKDRRKYWVDKCLGYCDGNSTKRIVDKLEEICG